MEKKNDSGHSQEDEKKEQQLIKTLEQSLKLDD
jgi:hypothetical protein